MWWVYGLLFVLALLITGSAIYAFFWAAKEGQLRDLDAQSRSIFDEEEPEGKITDAFPGKKKKKKPAAPPPPAELDSDSENP